MNKTRRYHVSNLAVGVIVVFLVAGCWLVDAVSNYAKRANIEKTEEFTVVIEIAIQRIEARRRRLGSLPLVLPDPWVFCALRVDLEYYPHADGTYSLTCGDYYADGVRITYFSGSGELFVDK